MNQEVEQFFEKPQKWQEAFNLLRKLVQENKSLEEEYKWMHPCYTYQGKNVVLIHGFKAYCALLFYKGVLLKDKKKLLIQQTENVQAARQLRFTDVTQITKLKAVIKDYIQEAVEIERSGQKVAMKKVSDYPIPEAFQKVLDKNKALHNAFYSLTPGRQKGYLFYFNQAKQPKTQETRVEKCIPKILALQGLDD